MLTYTILALKALYAASRYYQTGKEQCFLNESYAIVANVSLRKRIRVKDKEQEGQPAPKTNAVAEFIRSQDGYFTLFHLQDHDDVRIREAASSILTKYFQVRKVKQLNYEGLHENTVDYFRNSGPQKSMLVIWLWHCLY